ncbi:hypothetical protein Turpa_0813 [Turneriella parva DSM 21527]|uniref:Secreted protein n=1 Tax=Turneriella parva (strain ATCC BAA-1111 / DSM 21527 / NCTC 11395 / H) TaxID=869212 RepID=I4B2F7_TURPD|nr:hypothetical protein Turpa_0813 [Turneriella parva DSM 21527]
MLARCRIILFTAGFAAGPLCLHALPGGLHTQSTRGTGYDSEPRPPTDCMRSNQCAAATYGQESKKERNHQKLCAEALRELDTRPQPGTNLKLSSCYR